MLTTRETVLEDKRNSPGGASEAVNNKKNSAGGTREAVNSRSNSAGGGGGTEALSHRRNSARGAREAFNNRSNSAGGTREVVYNMRISAGGAREPNKALDALRYMWFCEQVSCQTVYGQPQDSKGCASRLVPEEFKWGWKIKDLDFSVTCTHKINGENQVHLQRNMDYNVHMHASEEEEFIFYFLINIEKILISILNKWLFYLFKTSGKKY